MARALILVLLLTGCASDPLYYTMQGTRLLDGCTTLGVSDDPTLKESNPILGDNPSDGEIVAHVAGGLLLQHLIYMGFERWNPRAAKWFAGLMTAGNTYVSASNISKGARCP